MVQLGNINHIGFIILFGLIAAMLYFVLKNRTRKTQRIVLASILFFNFAIHFLKALFPPYNTSLAAGIENMFMLNICAVSVCTFPFIYLSKNKFFKDGMIYLGLMSGILAMIIPTEAIGKNIATLDLWRFYICHAIIWIVPLLEVLLGHWKLSLKRIYAVPFYIMLVLCLIIANQTVMVELGMASIRNSDFLNINYRNPSLIWGPTDDLAVLFTWLTPNFMKVAPFGAFAGQTKYWPLFYQIPAIFFYFIIIPIGIYFLFRIKVKRKKEPGRSLPGTVFGF